MNGKHCCLKGSLYEVVNKFLEDIKKLGCIPVNKGFQTKGEELKPVSYNICISIPEERQEEFVEIKYSN